VVAFPREADGRLVGEHAAPGKPHKNPGAIRIVSSNRGLDLRNRAPRRLARDSGGR
jgi:hypothetical protein